MSAMSQYPLVTPGSGDSVLGLQGGATKRFAAAPYISATTFSGLPAAASYSGSFALVTNLGAAPGVWLVSDGTRWKTFSGEATLKALGNPIAGIANTETIILQTLIPAAAWQTNDTIRVWLTTTKSGTTDIGNLTVRVGTAGTTADTAITGLSAFALMGATAVSGGGIFDIKLLSATSAQKLGSNSGNTHTYQNSSGTAAVAAATTITDASANALWVSVGLASAGATNTVSVLSSQIQLVTP